MKKNLVAVLTAVVMTASLVACGNAATEESTAATVEATVEESTVAETVEATTEAATEEATTEAATEEATTEAATEEATTEAATEEATTEAATEEATTEALNNQPVLAHREHRQYPGARDRLRGIFYTIGNCISYRIKNIGDTLYIAL